MPLDPSNPLGLQLCSFFKRGSCLKGADCFYVHTDQVKRVYGHPWFPFFSYVKSPDHLPGDNDVKIDDKAVQLCLKGQAIKTLRFCKAYPACKHGKYCSFLHDQRIQMRIMMEEAMRRSYVASIPKPNIGLSPNAKPFSPVITTNLFSPRPVQGLVLPQTLPQTCLPNLILSPVSGTVASSNYIPNPSVYRLPNQNQSTNPSPDFTMPPSSNAPSKSPSMFSFYSPQNQYKAPAVAVIETQSPVNPFEAHLKKASPLFQYS